MDLKIDELQTFLHVFQAGTFTKASLTLGLTQSALSQKIARIEETLQASLFIRHPRHLELTSSGEDLFLYAKEVIERQSEFIKRFNQYQNQNQLSGVLRIAGFSSIMRSMIIPQLSSLIRSNPEVSIEFRSFEMYELEKVLKSNQADLILTDYMPSLTTCEEITISREEYVIISSRKYKNIPNIFLDHGHQDNATKTYFNFIGEKTNYDRYFMGDVYSIIDGAASGLGKAVMSKHLIENDKRFKIHKKKKRYFRPIVLSYHRQSYYAPLQKKVIELLLKLSNL
ncbi:LysR family transcriptional regulator [Bacteriovoracaceae bacterium]|nr:LysR family transcriptional regulator [Bacteriovoracaceae bacterium]